MLDQVGTIIVGGGQAGLALSYYLKLQGRGHVVLEQSNKAGNAWRNHRWDSFVLNTPNWQTRLPGAEYQGNDPDGLVVRPESFLVKSSSAQESKMEVLANKSHTIVAGGNR